MFTTEPAIKICPAATHLLLDMVVFTIHELNF